MSAIRKVVLTVMLAALYVAAVDAKPPRPAVPGPTAKGPTGCAHAFCKVVGGILFVAEDGIDVVHAGLDVATRGLTAMAPVKILVPVAYVVGEADKLAAQVDTATEHAESYLFGQSN